MSDMIEVFSSLIGALSGVLGTLLFYKLYKRRELAQTQALEIETELSTLTAYQKQIDFMNKQLETAFQQLGRLQQIINENRDRIIELLDEVNSLKIMLKEESEHRQSAEQNACVLENCPNRINLVR